MAASRRTVDQKADRAFFAGMERRTASAAENKKRAKKGLAPTLGKAAPTKARRLTASERADQAHFADMARRSAGAKTNKKRAKKGLAPALGGFNAAHPRAANGKFRSK